MLNLSLTKSKDEPMRVLCLGAHCDDIEIGCGATLLKLSQTIPTLSVTCVVFSSNDVRAAEVRKSTAELLGDRDRYDLHIFDYRNGFFPYHGAEIKDRFEELKTTIQPDIVFTHYAKDYHQDHRLVSELTWNTFRDHLIFEYEIPKYDGGMGSPSVFVPVDQNHVQRKCEILMSCFESQRHRNWFTKSTFDGLMRLRGIECNSKSGYAEAYYTRKLVLG
jgi:LmbE family N-acetylglucosaminyl deacetylase